jgi:alginate O-acetyltransferase complex protein AlgJ
MKSTARIYSIVLTILFICLVSVCFLNDIFHFYKVPETSQTENRKLASRPLFDINKLDPYPRLYENYFNDQFPFRQDMSLMNTLICFFCFHQSPLPGQVELGKNGWLFFDQKESIVYQGKFNLASWQISSVVTELHFRTLKLRNKGIKFYVAFPPVKPEIYPEFLPVDFRRAPGGTVTDRIVKAVKADTVIQYIDLKEALLKAKVNGRLYNLTDNHWNEIGAFYAYNAIIDRIRKDFPSVKPVTRSDFYFNPTKSPGGNLANMIGLAEYIGEIRYLTVFKNSRTRHLVPPHKKPDWASYIDDYEVVKTTGDSTLPSTVIIRDSYTNTLMEFFDESFNTNTYIFDAWRYDRNEAIIADQKPDIVLLIIFEPHISHLVGVW